MKPNERQFQKKRIKTKQIEIKKIRIELSTRNKWKETSKFLQEEEWKKRDGEKTPSKLNHSFVVHTHSTGGKNMSSHFRCCPERRHLDIGWCNMSRLKGMDVALVHVPIILFLTIILIDEKIKLPCPTY
jgi:hypothetical protein